MNKLLLIIKREYLTRVKKKSFILVTLLTPLGFGLLMFISGYITSQSMNTSEKIVVVDDSNVIDADQISTESLVFSKATKPLADLKKTYVEDGFDILLHVPKLDSLTVRNLTVNYYSAEKLGLTTNSRISRKIRTQFREHKVSKSSVDRQILDGLKIEIDMENAAATDEESIGDTSSQTSVGISTALGYGMGFLMYMVIFIYGSQVMRSVMEEKINRIVEVMISSVKPFQLMMGKITGVGLVGLTQLAIWLILIPVILLVANAFFGFDTTSALNGEEAQQVMSEMQSNGKVATLYKEFMSLNWVLIIPAFVLFFFGGYFIYSSLFAAVGSAVGDDLAEGQQLTLPIVIPVILALVMVPTVFNDPNGPLAVFGSMFPLFSPIVMPARLPFDPPVWQVVLSIVILFASVAGVAWVAGRIYRTGILLYGKKVSFKELAKWIFYKG